MSSIYLIFTLTLTLLLLSLAAHLVFTLNIPYRYSLYLHFYVLRGTIFTEFTILKLMISDCGIVLPALLSYNNFRMAWYSYLALLDINYTEGFKCSHCGSTPKTVIMDATSLAFRKELDWCNLFLPESKLLISGR